MTRHREILPNCPLLFLLVTLFQPSQSIVVQETYDPSWQATAGGRTLPVRRDVMGFLWVDAPPGDRDIRLDFTTPLENRIGRMITLATILVLLTMAILRRFWEPLV